MLSEYDVKELATDHELPTLTVKAIIAAVLDKLTAGVEVPEPGMVGLVYEARGTERGFTRDQLIQFGASQRLAGREQAIEECKNVVRKKCASPTAYEAIRALAASPQEQT